AQTASGVTGGGEWESDVREGYQTSLKSRVSRSGLGVDRGAAVTVRVMPGEADRGLVFQRAGPDGEAREFRALVTEIGATDLCTMLGDPSGPHVATVEHL